MRELGELIRTSEVSPVELTELSLDRLRILGPEFNALVTLTHERAISQAIRADKEIKTGKYRGPLHGIPYGAKDLLATSDGIPTTWGATPFSNQTFDHDATVIQKLEDAGAILVAKLATMELAAGMGTRRHEASFTGPGINPWNRATWSGGSSNGPASAVSAGLVPFAIGSETWSSIISPSALCGITGLRPTYGRVSRFGAMALCWTLDKLGPMCLTADDCGLVLEAIAGPDTSDPSASHLPFTYNGRINAPKSKFKLGVIKHVTEHAEEDIKSNFRNTLDDLSEFATIEEIVLPDLPYDAVTRTIMISEAASVFDEFTDTGKFAELTASDRYSPYPRYAVLAQDYLKALRLRSIIAKTIDKILSKYDALVSPTEMRVAPPIEQENKSLGIDVMGAIGNGAGLPSITVPSGFSKSGLPIGVQFMGRVYEENVILDLALKYQSRTEWHLYHPTDPAVSKSN